VSATSKERVVHKVVYDNPELVENIAAEGKNSYSVKLRGSAAPVTFFIVAGVLESSVTPEQASVLAQAPGFEVEGFPPYSESPAAVQNWMDEGERIFQERQHGKKEAASTGGGFWEQAVSFLGEDFARMMLKTAMENAATAAQAKIDSPAPIAQPVLDLSYANLVKKLTRDQVIDLVAEFDGEFEITPSNFNATASHLSSLSKENHALRDRLALLLEA